MVAGLGIRTTKCVICLFSSRPWNPYPPYLPWRLVTSRLLYLFVLLFLQLATIVSTLSSMIPLDWRFDCLNFCNFWHKQLEGIGSLQQSTWSIAAVFFSVSCSMLFSNVRSDACRHPLNIARIDRQGSAHFAAARMPDEHRQAWQPLTSLFLRAKTLTSIKFNSKE